MENIELLIFSVQNVSPKLNVYRENIKFVKWRVKTEIVKIYGHFNMLSKLYFNMKFQKWMIFCLYGEIEQ